jgi:hypothetical protein
VDGQGVIGRPARPLLSSRVGWRAVIQIPWRGAKERIIRRRRRRRRRSWCKDTWQEAGASRWF